MNERLTYQSNTANFSASHLCVSVFGFMGFACFTLSLFMPIFFTSAENIYGFWVLITGWLGAIFVQFAWYANPLNLLALLLMREYPRISLLLSILAISLASGTFIFNEMPIGINYEKVFIKELGLGFYVWYVANIFFLLAILINNSSSSARSK